MLKINHLAVRPEYVEGRMANCDTAPKGRGGYFGYYLVIGVWDLVLILSSLLPEHP